MSGNTPFDRLYKPEQRVVVAYAAKQLAGAERREGDLSKLCQEIASNGQMVESLLQEARSTPKTKVVRVEKPAPPKQPGMSRAIDADALSVAKREFQKLDPDSQQAIEAAIKQKMAEDTGLRRSAIGRTLRYNEILVEYMGRPELLEEIVAGARANGDQGRER